MTLPYSRSEAGQTREAEIRKTLRNAGATAVGFMQDDDADQIIAQFRLRGREITVPIHVGAYANAWLRENPRGDRQKARTIAERAAWAVLADWIKAQAAMMACGFQDADTAFLPYVALPDGRSVGEAIKSTDGPLRLPPPGG